MARERERENERGRERRKVSSVICDWYWQVFANLGERVRARERERATEKERMRERARERARARAREQAKERETERAQKMSCGIDNTHQNKPRRAVRHIRAFLDGYCSTVQGERAKKISQSKIAQLILPENLSLYSANFESCPTYE